MIAAKVKLERGQWLIMHRGRRNREFLLFISKALLQGKKIDGLSTGKKSLGDDHWWSGGGAGGSEEEKI